MNDTARGEGVEPRIRAVLARVGQRVAPAHADPDPAVYTRLGAFTLVMVAVLIPVVITSAFELMRIYAGQSDIKTEHAYGGLLFLLFALILPRAAFRSSLARTSKEVLGASRWEPVSVAGSVAVFQPTIVATLLAAVYIHSYWGAGLIFIFAALIQAIIVHGRHHASGGSSIYEAVSHVFLTFLSISAAYLTVHWYGEPWADIAYPLHQPLTDPGHAAETWGLLPILMIGALAGITVHGTTKWIIQRATEAKKPGDTCARFFTGLSQYVFDSRRVTIAITMGAVAWVTSVVSEFAGIGEDVLGMALALGAWLVAWAVLWVLASLEWVRTGNLLLRSWEQQIARNAEALASGQLTPNAFRSYSINQAVRIASMYFGADHVIGYTCRTNAPGEGVSLYRRGSVLEVQQMQNREGFAFAEGLSLTAGSSEKRCAELLVQDSGFLCMRLSRTPQNRMAFETRLQTAFAGDRVAERYGAVSSQVNTVLDPETHMPTLTAFTSTAERMLEEAGQRSQTFFVAAVEIDSDDYRHYLLAAESADPDGKHLKAFVAREISATKALHNLSIFVAPDDAEPRVWIAGICSTFMAGVDTLRDVLAEIGGHSFELRKKDFAVQCSYRVGYGFNQLHGVMLPSLMDAARQGVETTDLTSDGFGIGNVDDLMAHMFGGDIVSEFLRDMATGDAKVRLDPVHSTSGGALAGYTIKYTWVHSRYGELQTEALLRLLDREAALRAAVLPDLIGTIVDEIHTLTVLGSPVSGIVSVPVPLAVLHLPLAEMTPVLAPLIEALPEGALLNLGLRELDSASAEIIPVLRSLGIGLTVRADSLFTQTPHLAKDVSQVLFSEREVRNVLEGDSHFMSSANVMCPKSVMLCGIAPADATESELAAAGFDTWMETRQRTIAAGVGEIHISARTASPNTQ